MLQRLQTERITAMKEQDLTRREVLQSIFEQAQKFAKEDLKDVDDSYVLKALKIELKQLKEALDMMRSNMTAEKISIYEAKIEIVESYFPKQLSEQQIKNHIGITFEELVLVQGLKKEMKSMGILMKNLTQKLEGQVDNGLLSKLIKEFLNS